MFLCYSATSEDELRQIVFIEKFPSFYLLAFMRLYQVNRCYYGCIMYTRLQGNSYLFTALKNRVDWLSRLKFIDVLNNVKTYKSQVLSVINTSSVWLKLHQVNSSVCCIVREYVCSWLGVLCTILYRHRTEFGIF